MVLTTFKLTLQQTGASGLATTALQSFFTEQSHHAGIVVNVQQHARQGALDASGLRRGPRRLGSALPLLGHNVLLRCDFEEDV